MLLSKYVLKLACVCLLAAPSWAQWFTSVTESSSATSCVINWNSAAATEGRVKYGETTSYGKVTPFESSYNTRHSVTVTGLSSGTAYHFSVVGRDTTALSLASKDQICTTTTTGTAHSADLDWNASTTPNVTYNLYRSDTSGTGYALVASALTILSYTDTTVVSGTTYYYVVTSFDGNAESAYSNQTTAVVP
jgi:fibronectin type 3 domain-containing protein